MTATSLIWLSDGQDTFARRLVADGRYPSVSAAVEHGLDLLQGRRETEEADKDALRALIDQRRRGPFVNEETMTDRVEAMLTAKRQAYGLAD